MTCMSPTACGHAPFQSLANGQGPYLQGDAANRLDSVSCQVGVNVIDILCQLGGNLIGIGLICNGRQDLQLQLLDVGGLVHPAEEGCVYLQTHIAIA